ncbi:MAG: Rrf2 family transcriptional regulator [Atribacterota bacterium]
MRFSTRSRYGLRLMIQLALSYEERKLLYIKEIAEREGISEKYLTQIVIPLKAKGLITSRRGSGGGYRLSRHPSQITVREVMEALEGNILPVDCLEGNTRCERASFCVARKVWQRVGRKIIEALEEFTLEDLTKMNQANQMVEYCI